MSELPANVIVSRILLTDLLQQRDFLKWMSRRYKDVNLEQSEAFATGARLFDELREELKDGLFTADEPAAKELFTEELLEVLEKTIPELPAEVYTKIRELAAVTAGADMMEKDRVDRRDAFALISSSIDLEGPEPE